MKTVLWWGRFDPDYSRNRILWKAFESLGWKPRSFRPAISQLGTLEASLRRIATPDLVFVPCFRQRDIAAARQYSRARGVPLMVDPLISAYDKQVFERAKFPEASRPARRLLDWERGLLQSADAVLADTPAHAQFFHSTLEVTHSKLHVVAVGADEDLFTPAPHTSNDPIEVLFFGSFLALHGPQTIVHAARKYRGPRVAWRMIGEGALLSECKSLAAGLDNVRFDPWLPYSQLPAAIGRADIVLGVFGDTPKAGRVIPNKVFQAMACAKPVITRKAEAYPAELANDPASGITWVPAGDAAALATAVRSLAEHPDQIAQIGRHARASYERFFSNRLIFDKLRAALVALSLSA